MHQVRRPSARADLISFIWIVQPCPKTCESKPQRWSNADLNKRSPTGTLKRTSLNLHMLSPPPRSLDSYPRAGFACGRLLDALDKEIAH
jgi:hypothetical protein